jgi:ATP-dependent RNA helicase HelY
LDRKARFRTHQGRSGRRQERPRAEEDYSKPRIEPALKPLFRKIGVPEPEPFTPDPFQREALALIETKDVLVSAPTGSGKTWIATEAIHACLARNMRVWYASPLKALSNSIYGEFIREFGPETCGILTGDRKENPDAPVIVGTTEILRNQLYDSMHTGTNIGADLVILDEAHYLSDPDRGVVWEEVLIYLPPRVRLLLLSATISNAEEVCAWLEEIRGAPNRVVRAFDRPVPLEMLFLFPEGLVVRLAGKTGLNPRVKDFVQTGTKKWRRGPRQVDFCRIIGLLREMDLLPAIFFLKSRSDCDRALLTCLGEEQPPGNREELEEAVQRFLVDYPHLEKHRQKPFLVDHRVASHHGGQLPYWKVLIEKMMNKGYLEAIFSTSTVAAGVNFPARTVVLVQSDRYNGREFVDLTATDLHQMIGRAGRRGMDRIGFALVIPGLHQDPQLLYELKDSPPEPLRSQIHINFSMTLNLLLSHTPQEIHELLAKSFSAFQEREPDSSFRDRWNAMLSQLEKLIPRGKCDTADPYEVLENIQKRSELDREARQLTRAVHYEAQVQAFKAYLKPGRLVLHRNGNVYVVFNTSMEEGRLICAAHSLRKSGPKSARGIALKKLDINQIKEILDFRVEIPEDYSTERLLRAFDALPLHELKGMGVDIPLHDLDMTTASGERLASLPCEECIHLKTCHLGRKGELRRLLRQFRSISLYMDAVKGGLWLSFKRHLRFLKETGFVDPQDRLTSDGLWASNLRLDQPLLIAEAIRKGAFHGVSPEILAGGLAPFVWDRAQEVEIKPDLPQDVRDLDDLFRGILEQISLIRDLKTKRGFENPPLSYWPAPALFFWAKGLSWDKLLEYFSVDEGDMASLIMRTADHLRQVVSLRDSHPALADTAGRAVGLIVREPVYLP